MTEAEVWAAAIVTYREQYSKEGREQTAFTSGAVFALARAHVVDATELCNALGAYTSQIPEWTQNPN